MKIAFTTAAAKFFMFFSILNLFTSCNQQDEPEWNILLNHDWQMQSSQQISESGKELSTISYQTNKWFPINLPATVMGGLTQNGMYKDIFIGTNYKMSDKKPFEHSWWFRKEFKLPKHDEYSHADLCIDGISYSANIWLNGTQIADRNSIYGPFRQFRIDITPFIKESNVLAIEVFRAQPGNPNIGFVDWNPRPLDESMGIFRDISISLSGAVSLARTAIRSTVNTQTLNEAWVSIETELTNHSNFPVDGVLTGTLEGKSFQIPISLKPKEKRIEKITSEQVPNLHIKDPRLWWCHNLGNPEMYQMNLSFNIDQKVSDKETINFGIRDIKEYFTKEGYRGFLLNGKKILIRSAGWSDDIFLRNDAQRNETEIQYVKDMNLNSIRLENFWGTSQNLYDLCDKYGILILAGWSCHWEWEHYIGSPCDEFGGIKSETDMELINTSLKDQVCWLRNHPSIVAWFLGSDMLPRPELEKKYQETLSQIDNRPYICAAKELTSEISGPTGMKMAGPYDYVSPNYWYSPEAPGGAFGFNTETGIGAQLPVIESIKKMIPQESLWPLNQTWNYHCTASESEMNSLDVLTTTITQRYGCPKDLDDYLRKADLLNYEGTRSMFEAFRVNIPQATGIVQWMLNSAWPSLYWQLYDHYLIPTAAYYSVKKANVPQQLIYDYEQHKVFAVNEGKDSCSMQADMTLYGSDSQLLYKSSICLNIAPYTVKEVFDLSNKQHDGFLFLNLTGSDKNYQTDNFYCLSAQPDILDWGKTTWVRTPLKQSADFTRLNSLKESKCTATATLNTKEGQTVLNIELKNTSDTLAFFIRLKLKDKDNELIVPIFWEDNYFSLPPKGKRKIRCFIPQPTMLPDNMTLSISGWNVTEQNIVLKNH